MIEVLIMCSHVPGPGDGVSLSSDVALGVLSDSDEFELLLEVDSDEVTSDDLRDFPSVNRFVDDSNDALTRSR